VLANLLLDALDALPQHDAAFRLRIRIVGMQLQMACADNGHGTSTALHNSLFHPLQWKNKRN
jgi:C4-dicarboxylate-specific signal transduction histidine kinase